MKKTKILFGTSLTIFLILLVTMLTNIQLIQPLDDGIRVIVNAHRTSWANEFLAHFTQLFNSQETIVWTIVTVLVAWLVCNHKVAFQVTLTIGTGIILNRLIKLWVQRPRPSVDILMHYGSFSFPSGHSSAVALICGSLIVMVTYLVQRQWLKRTITGLLVILVIAIGLSRIYVGAHYPSDVLAGWCLGCAVVTGFQLLFSRLQ